MLNKITGIVLVILGLYLFVAFEKVISVLMDSTFFQIALLIYCCLVYYLSSVKKNHIKTYLSTFGFFLTITLFSLNNFEIINIQDVIIWSFYFIPGVSFLFLYISDLDQKLFLALAIGWFCLSGIQYLILPKSFTQIIINNIINIISSALPFLLVAVGVLSFLKKK